MSALDHALDYAARGLPVFPCKPSGADAKRPFTTHGFKDASTDPHQIRAWWGRWPDALIGAAMGPTAGVFAVDPDAPKDVGDPDGLAAWNALVEQHGGIPHTQEHETPGGGRHVLFAYPEGRRITNREGALKGTGINVRGDGGYLVMPPSRMADGRAYRLRDDLDFGTFAKAPAWLLDLITAEPQSQANTEQEPWPEQAQRRSSATDDAAARYVAAAVNRECDEVARCTRGGRNNRLNDAAFALGQLIGAGALDRDEAERRLWDAATACGHVRDEGRAATLATMKSGLDGGTTKPRDLSRVGQRQERRRGRAERSGAPPSDANDGQPAAAGDNVPLISEDEAGLLFAEQYRGKLRFSVSHGRWFVWDGTIWRENTTNLAFTLTRELVRQMAEAEPEKVRIAAGRAAFAGAVERYARADRAFAVTADVWDSDPWLLGTPGGTVDLRTGALRPARPEDGITRSTAVTPADVAQCPLWLKFLGETFAGDAAVIAFTQRWAGYCLTGLTREHALVFGHGGGGNGKSVYVNVHVGIAGDYAVTAAMDTFIAAHGERHTTDLAMLRGARLVTASETEEGRQWAESRIKSLTGGDPVTARFMRQDNFTFLPAFKLLVIGNHKPSLRNVDDAARRRFNLLPFLFKPAVPDRELEDKLKAEWPAILRWMIEGCLAWQREGLKPPESVREATEAYFGEQDTFTAWLEEDCEVTPSNTHRTEFSADLYAAWQRYAKAAGEASMTRTAFGERIKRTGAVPFKGTGGVRMYRCICLRPHARAEGHAHAA